MTISLVKAKQEDAKTIHSLQIKSFKALLEKYQDFDISPGNEPLEKVVFRINQTGTDYYMIKSDSLDIGGIRILKKEDKRYRISPIFILPQHQGKGIGQRVFQIVEEIYHDAKIWELDTILEEAGNCYLYEKLGYEKTGKTEIINSKMTIVFYEKII